MKFPVESSNFNLGLVTKLLFVIDAVNNPLAVNRIKNEILAFQVITLDGHNEPSLSHYLKKEHYLYGYNQTISQ